MASERRVAHGVDTEELAVFAAHAAENPEDVQLGVSARPTDEGTATHSLATIDSYVLGGETIAPGGRLAISDIISEEVMPESIKNDEDLWAACIGSAEQIDWYTTAIEAADFSATDIRENTQYEFISERAANACEKYSVKSISLGATK